MMLVRRQILTFIPFLGNIPYPHPMKIAESFVFPMFPRTLERWLEWR